MNLGRLAIPFALIVVASLNAILLVGAARSDFGAPSSALSGLVLILDLSIVVSSIVLVFVFARLKWRRLSLLFLANLAVFLVAAAARLFGLSFRPAVLFATDLYWLNLYLVVLARHWRAIADAPA